MKSVSQTKLPNGAVAVRRQSTPAITMNTKHLLNTGRGPQTSRKANQHPWNESMRDSLSGCSWLLRAISPLIQRLCILCYVAREVLMLLKAVKSEPQRQETEVQDFGPSENSSPHGTLIDKSPPEGPQLSTDRAPPKSQQGPVWDAPYQSFSKTGAQLCTSTGSLSKSTLNPQILQNTLLDTALTSRETRSSSIHQNTGTSLWDQLGPSWSQPTPGGQTPQLRGAATFQPAERKPQTQYIKQN